MLELESSIPYLLRLKFFHFLTGRSLAFGMHDKVSLVTHLKSVISN